MQTKIWAVSCEATFPSCERCGEAYELLASAEGDAGCASHCAAGKGGLRVTPVVPSDSRCRRISNAGSASRTAHGTPDWVRSPPSGPTLPTSTGCGPIAPRRGRFARRGRRTADRAAAGGPVGGSASSRRCESRCRRCRFTSATRAEVAPACLLETAAGPRLLVVPRAGSLRPRP